MAVLALTVTGTAAGLASGAGNRNPVHLQFSERSCTFKALVRWHGLDFTPADVHFVFYRLGIIVQDDTIPVSAGDTTATDTYTGTASTTSNQFWLNIYVERFPGDPSYAGAYSKTIVANCD